MERYIGLDVHSQSTTLAVMSANGKRLHHRVLETSATALIDELKTIAGTKHLILEEGTQSAWLSIVLRPHVQTVVVTVPKETRDKAKSDLEDAFARAEELRLNGVKRKVYKPQSNQDVELQQAMRLYGYLTKDVVRAKNRFKASLRSWGVTGLDQDVYDEEVEVLEAIMSNVPEGVAHNAGQILKQVHLLEELRKPARARLLEQARKRRSEYDVLVSLPGIGPLRAALLLAIVVTPARFRKPRHFWSYVGLAINTTSSGEYRQTNGRFERQKSPLTRGLKKGNPALKAIFKGAAQTVVHQKETSKLQQHYLKLLQRNTKPNLALLTLARKIAAITLAAWKEKKEYDETKHTAFP